MSYFKAKMHQIRFRLGLRPRPRWGSSQCSPRPPNWISGVLFLREGNGREGKGRKGRKGEGREGERLRDGFWGMDAPGTGKGKKGEGEKEGWETGPPNPDDGSTPLNKIIHALARIADSSMPRQ